MRWNPGDFVLHANSFRERRDQHVFPAAVINLGIMVERKTMKGWKENGTSMHRDGWR